MILVFFIVPPCVRELLVTYKYQTNIDKILIRNFFSLGMKGVKKIRKQNNLNPEFIEANKLSSKKVLK